MKFPIIELVDRYTIARVKYDKTSGANAAELDFYSAQIAKLDVELIQAEIGQRALDIRDLNNYRVQYKNSIADKLNDPVREIKQDHTSEN